MEHLDARLGTIAAMTPRCRAVADIGCVHGLLIAALLEDGRCDYGIAADINPQPLKKARRELERRGLTAQSECRLTNGLCGIAPVGVDAVVIAGMGGELIADILSRWDYTENPTVTYLLQPMTRPVHLRQWLYAHRFTLQEERCCRANGKLYSVMRAQYTGCPTEETPTALTTALWISEMTRWPGTTGRRCWGGCSGALPGWWRRSPPPNGTRSLPVLPICCLRCGKAAPAGGGDRGAARPPAGRPRRAGPAASGSAGGAAPLLCTNPQAYLFILACTRAHTGAHRTRPHARAQAGKAPPFFPL